MATAGPLDHTATALAVMGDQAWSSPNNAISDGGGVASVGSPISGSVTDTRKGSAVLNFGVGTPASVEGLTVTYKANKQPGDDDYTLHIPIFEGTSSTAKETKSVTAPRARRSTPEPSGA
jgi:hypothetical protein